jgi:hypothetical protein
MENKQPKVSIKLVQPNLPTKQLLQKKPKQSANSVAAAATIAATAAQLMKVRKNLIL